MVTLTISLFGFLKKTWHKDFGVNLPVFDWKGNFSVVSVEFTTGPTSVPAPSHSVEMAPASTPNTHTAQDPTIPTPPTVVAPEKIQAVKDAANALDDWS